MEDNGRYKSLVSLSLKDLTSVCGVVDVRGEILLSPSGVINMYSLDSGISAQQPLKSSRNCTCSLPDFSWNCSREVLELWS